MNAARRDNDVGVVVKKNRRRTVTPFSPSKNARKRVVNRREESGAVNAIECVAKIYFKGRQTLARVV